MKIKKLMCAFLGIFAVVACTDNGDEGVVVNDGEKAAIVSLYLNENCQEQDLLLGNVLVKDGNPLKLDVNIPVACQKVYMKYNSASGEQVKVLPLLATTVSRALTADAAAFDWATTRSASVTVALPEDAVQPTSEEDAGFRFYHNTGVAMFEDNWPIESGKDNDLNDVVFEYDLKVTECQDDDLLPAQGYKEGLLLTLDVRAKGGVYPIRLGVELEGLNSKFISQVSTRILLKKGQGMADELAAGTTEAVTRTTLFGQNQYCKVDVDMKNGNPIITLDGLCDLGNNTDFFQTTEGFITPGQGMLRAEIRLTGKLRSELSASDGEAQLEAFRNLILDTKKQNFFITTQNGKNKETHMKGYAPTYTYTSYEEDGAGEMMEDAMYCNHNGFVWGIKVPAGVAHVYEKVLIDEAYPEFREWVNSNGTKRQDWYLHPVEGKVVKYW